MRWGCASGQNGCVPPSAEKLRRFLGAPPQSLGLRRWGACGVLSHGSISTRSSTAAPRHRLPSLELTLGLRGGALRGGSPGGETGPLRCPVLGHAPNRREPVGVCSAAALFTAARLPPLFVTYFPPFPLNRTLGHGWMEQLFPASSCTRRAEVGTGCLHPFSRRCCRCWSLPRAANFPPAPYD